MAAATGSTSGWRAPSAFEVIPLRMTAPTTSTANASTLPAINEVSLLRETRQTAKLEVMVNGRVVLPELVCDGVLVVHPGRLDRL